MAGKSIADNDMKQLARSAAFSVNIDEAKNGRFAERELDVEKSFKPKTSNSRLPCLVFSQDSIDGLIGLSEQGAVATWRNSTHLTTVRGSDLSRQSKLD